MDETLNNGVGTAPAEGATPSEPVNETPAEQAEGAETPASSEATPEADASTPEQAN